MDYYYCINKPAYTNVLLYIYNSQPFDPPATFRRVGDQSVMWNNLVRVRKTLSYSAKLKHNNYIEQCTM